MLKRKLCGTIALMMMLSACENTGDTEKITTAEETDRLEETVAVTEQTVISTAFAEDGQTEQTVQTAQTIPALPNESAENAAAVSVSEVVGAYRTLDLSALADENSRFVWITHFSGDIVCAFYERTDSEKGRYIQIIDLARSEAVGRIDDENATDFGAKRDGSYVCLTGEDHSAVYKVNADGSYTLTDHETLWGIPDACGDHSVTYDETYSLLDAESGKVLVKSDRGSGDPVYSISYNFVSAVDDRRFIYRGMGWEWTAGFGIYDFVTGKAEDIPNTNRTYYVGSGGSMLYLAEGEMDGDGKSIYSVDLNTYEATPLRDMSDMGNIWASYDMPDDGDVIGAYIHSREPDAANAYLLLDPFSGEIVRELPDVFAKNNTFLTENYICNADAADGGRLYLADRDKPYAKLDMNRFADEGYTASDIQLCGNDNVLVSYISGDHSAGPYVAVIDIAEGKEITRLETGRDDGYVQLSPISPCAELGRAWNEVDIYGNDITHTERERLCVFAPDGSYKIIEDSDIYIWDYPTIFGDHIICTKDGSLTELDSGEVLIPVYREEGDENGFKTIYYRFDLPIDENRFIYFKGGYETMHGIGIYDLETGAAADLTDVRILPRTISGNKLYSEEYEYAGYGTHIYVTDLDTGKTEVFCTVPYVSGGKSPNTYSMIFAPSDGEFIGALEGGWSIDNRRLALIDTKNGGVFYEITLPDASEKAFATDSFICVKNSMDNSLYLIDREKIGSIRRSYEWQPVKSALIKKYGDSDSWKGDNIVISEFTNIMGVDGYICEHVWDAFPFSEKTYVGIVDDSPVIIGNSFGFEGHEDFSVDIDGDGVTELVCNCMFGADGAENVYIFKMTDNGVMVCSDYESLADVEFEPLPMASAYHDVYDPETGKITVTCMPKGTEDIIQLELDIDPAKLNFELYEPLY